MPRYARAVTILIAALGLVAAAALSGLAGVDEESSPPPDTVFQEIHLSEDGILAVDTAGYEWYYDFGRETFVLGRPEPVEPPATDQNQSDESDEIPIEERCTEEIFVKPLETKPVTVGYDEFVDDDITVLGRVTIKGWVTGNVASLNRRVLVTETGRVDGNIEAPTVVVRDGGIVKGRIIERASPFEIDLGAPFSAEGIIVVASFTAFLLLCALLFLGVAPRQVGNISVCIDTARVKTFFLGLLLWLLLGPAVVLVAITIVGIPLTPLVPLAYVLGAVLGMISFGNMIGRFLGRKMFSGQRSRLFQTLLGILSVMGLWFLSAALLGSSGAAEGFGIFFLVVAILVTAFPVAAGPGAALLTRFGFRTYRDWKHQAKEAAEPPPPAPPPIHPEHITTPPSDQTSPGAET